MEPSALHDTDVAVVAQKSYSSNRTSSLVDKSAVDQGQTNGEGSENKIPAKDPEAEVIVLSPEHNVSNGVSKLSTSSESDGASKVAERQTSTASLANDSPSIPLPDKQPFKGRVIRATYTKPSEWDLMKCGRCGKLTRCQLKIIGTKSVYFCDETCLRAASLQWKASSIQIMTKRTASPSNLDSVNAAVNNVLLSLNTSPPPVASVPAQPDPGPSPGPQLLAKTVDIIPLEDGPPPAKRPNIQRESSSTDKFDTGNEPDGTVAAVFRCEQCSRNLDTPGDNTLYWEAMAFCGESCLGDYQQGIGSFCSVCNNAVTAASLGRYCVRFGYDIKQFCTLSCLQKAKTIHKLCTYCQRGLGPGESCIAQDDAPSVQIGGKRTVRFFCSASCVDAYKRVTGSNKGQESEVGPCAVCLAVREAFKQFYFQDRVQQFCSEPCYNAFLFVNKVVVGRCAMCQKPYDTTSHSTVHMLESARKSALSFCSRCCQNVYLTTSRVITPCANCNVKKYNFDMICRGGGAPGGHFCSLPCLNQVKNAVTTKVFIRHPCCECHQAVPLMYHIPQADGGKLSFCSKKCMDNHQKRLKAVSPSLPAPPPSSSTGTNTMTKTTVASGPGVMPIITKVTSLAPINTSNAASSSSALSKDREEDEPIVVESPSPEKHKTPTATTPSSATPRRSLVISVPMQHFLMNVGPEPVLQHNKVIQCGPVMVSAHSQTELASDGKREEKESEPKEELTTPTRQFCESGTQTEPWTALLPIPVPIYVPVPVPLFNFPYPVPLGVPIPLPVPLPVPAHLTSVADKEISPVQESTAEPKPAAIEEAPRSPSVLPSAASVSSISPALPTVALPSPVPSEKKLEELTAVQSSVSSQDSQDLKGRRVSSAGSKVVEQSALPAKIPVEIEEAFREEFLAEGWPPNSPQTALGRKVWELWVESENKKIPEGLKLKAGPASRKPKLWESDLQQISTESLSSALPRMIREVKKQNGSSFHPDSLYYFCLGIQESLTQNGRKDCIFYDKEYNEFQRVLNGICQDILQLNTTEQRLSEVREEHLWQAKLLGTETPQVLLFTLAYFNTKYFGLKSVQDHQKLSFRHLMKRWRRIPETGQRVPTSLTYTPASDAEGAETASESKLCPPLKLIVRDDTKEKCAIRIYEFYLAKCPQDADPQGKFYLSPSAGCLASDPVWFTTETQPEEELRVNLERILSVRDVQEMY